MKLKELLADKLTTQYYFGLYRLLSEDENDVLGPNEERMKQALLDIITAWRRQNPKALVLPLDKVMNSIHDPVVDIDPVKDKDVITSLLSKMNDVVTRVSPEENKIYLVGPGNLPGASKSQAEKDKEHVEKQASNTVKDILKGKK